jgi:penicillin-binding protein 1A
MTSILEGVVERGTAQDAKVLDFPLAGKTGTTNDSRDAWFVGYTQDLVVGVYIGFDNPKTLGPKETGGRVALPAFIDFMQSVYAERPKREFVVPSGISKIKVDHNTGTPPLPWSQEGQLITE